MKFTKLTSIIFASLLVLQGCGGGSNDSGPTLASFVEDLESGQYDDE